MYKLGTIRTFTTKQFKVEVDAVEEESLDLSWDEDGSVAKGLESGEFIAFCARARVWFKGQCVGTDYLGSCIYRSLAEFMDHKECGKQNKEYEAKGEAGRCGSYFKDMIHEAIAEARKTIKATQAVYVR
jgi:hypothetical protein